MKVVTIVLFLALAACGGVDEAEWVSPDIGGPFEVYTDPLNGCQYITLRGNGNNAPAQPRLNPDGTQVCGERGR